MAHAILTVSSRADGDSGDLYRNDLMYDLRAVDGVTGGVSGGGRT